MATAIWTGALLAVGVLTVDACDGACADRRGCMRGKCAALQRVVREGMPTSIEGADSDSWFCGTSGGRVAKSLAVVVLLQGRAITKVLNSDGLTKKGQAVFLEVGENGVVRVKKGEYDGAIDSGGREFSTEPAWLANPRDAIADRVERKLVVEVGFRGQTAISVTDDGDTMHSNVCVPFWGG